MLNFIGSMVLGAGLLMHGGLPAHATGTPRLMNQNHKVISKSIAKPQNNQIQGVKGTVTSVSGNTIILSVKLTPMATTTKTFTVNASTAKIVKNGNTASSTIANILVGDKLVVRGTVTGTNVVAKTIIDGIATPPVNKENSKPNKKMDGAKKPNFGQAMKAVKSH